MFQPSSLFCPIVDVQSVVPVLIGPAATLIPILLGALGAFLVAVGRKFVRLFTPVGMKEFVQFFWHQKMLSLVLGVGIAGVVLGQRNNWWRAEPPPPPPGAAGYEWANFRADAGRSGAAIDSPEPTTNDAVWARIYNVDRTFKTFYSSPAVVGDRVYIAAGDVGPMDPDGKGGILCLNAENGDLLWAYTPSDFRATYSSPSVVYKRNDDGSINYKEGYVVCGEGLHFVTDARVVCLTLDGKLHWQYRTRSHVESSPAIADGRVYIGAGDDGYYCFELEPTRWRDEANRIPEPLWHVGGERYQDCETSPVVHDGVVYVGLGLEGNAVVALDAATGNELWRVETPSPVFSAPTIGYRFVEEDGNQQIEKLLFIAMGNANVLQSAEQVRTAWPARMREKGYAPERIDRLMSDFRTNGEVWCVNISKVRPGETVRPEWTLTIPQSVLAVAFAPPQVTLQCSDIDDSLALGQTVTQQNSEAVGTVAAIDRSIGTVMVYPRSGRFAGQGSLAIGESVLAKVLGLGKSADPRVYFGAWDGKFRSVSTDGRILSQFDAGSAMANYPAVGKDYVYVATKGGTLFCLDAFDLRPLWQAGLGGLGVVSSPILGRGHIYIGTMEDGVRCIGRVKPLPPAWMKGAIGGVSDRVPLPGTFRRQGRYPHLPTGVDEHFRISAAMMPLPQMMHVEQSGERSGEDASGESAKTVEKLVRFVYAPVQHDGKFALLKLRHGEVRWLPPWPRRRGPEPEPVVWSMPFENEIAVPPAGIGSEIYVVEGGRLAASQPDAPANLHAVDVDANRLWNVRFETGTSGRFAIARQRIYIWSGPNTVSCVGLAGDDRGKLLWSRQCNGGGPSVGEPSISDGLLVAALADKLNVLDAETGRILWSHSLPALAVDGPIRVGSSVLLPVETGIARISLAGAETIWHAPIGRIAQPISVDRERLVAVTQAGTLHVLSLDDGLPLRLRDEYDLALSQTGSAQDQPAALRMTLAQGRYQLKDGTQRLGVVPTAKGYYMEDRRFVRLAQITGQWHLQVTNSVTVTSQPDGGFLLDFGTVRGVIRQHQNRWLLREENPREEQKASLVQIGEHYYGPGPRLRRVFDKDGQLMIQEGASDPYRLFHIVDQWYVQDVTDEFDSVARTDDGASLATRSGGRFNAIFRGDRWYNDQQQASGVTTVSRRLAPLQGVDPRIVPVLAGEQVIFGMVRPGAADRSDLMVMQIPEKHQVESLPEAEEKLAMPSPPGQTPDELVTGELTQSCRAEDMGLITMPLIIIEGNIYTATSDQGLVFLAAQR